MPGSITADWLGQLATLDTETVTVAAMDNTYSPPTATVALSSMSGELDTVTTTATWNGMTATLEVDDFTGMDAADVAWWAIAYSGDVVSSIEVGTPVTVTSGDTVSFPAGVAQAIRGNDLAARITVVEDALDEIEIVAGLPDPSGGSDGEVPTVSSGTYVLATPSGGGGSTLDWQSDGSWLDTFMIDGGDSAPSIVKPVHTGDTSTAIASGPAPVLLGVVQAAHRPDATYEGTATWFDNTLGVGFLLVIVDHDGGTLGTAGGLWIMDQSGTLTDTDEVGINLGSVAWRVDP